MTGTSTSAGIAIVTIATIMKAAVIGATASGSRCKRWSGLKKTAVLWSAVFFNGRAFGAPSPSLLLEHVLDAYFRRAGQLLRRLGRKAARAPGQIAHDLAQPDSGILGPCGRAKALSDHEFAEGFTRRIRLRLWRPDFAHDGGGLWLVLHWR